MISLKRILVPTDFSEQSEKALAYGLELAKMFKAELHILHAFDVTPITYGEGVGIGIESVVAIESAANEHLNGIVVDAPSDMPVVKRVVQGPAFVEIVRYARENDVDLVVVGTHGRGAVAHMLLGSVAEKVVRKAPCPVLVVRDGTHDFVMP